MPFWRLGSRFAFIYHTWVPTFAVTGYTHARLHGCQVGYGSRSLIRAFALVAPRYRLPAVTVPHTFPLRLVLVPVHHAGLRSRLLPVADCRLVYLGYWHTPTLLRLLRSRLVYLPRSARLPRTTPGLPRCVWIAVTVTTRYGLGYTLPVLPPSRLPAHSLGWVAVTRLRYTHTHGWITVTVWFPHVPVAFHVLVTVGLHGYGLRLRLHTAPFWFLYGYARLHLRFGAFPALRCCVYLRLRLDVTFSARFAFCRVTPCRCRAPLPATFTVVLPLLLRLPLPRCPVTFPAVALRLLRYVLLRLRFRARVALSLYTPALPRTRRTFTVWVRGWVTVPRLRYGYCAVIAPRLLGSQLPPRVYPPRSCSATGCGLRLFAWLFLGYTVGSGWLFTVTLDSSLPRILADFLTVNGYAFPVFLYTGSIPGYITVYRCPVHYCDFSLYIYRFTFTRLGCSCYGSFGCPCPTRLVHCYSSAVYYPSYPLRHTFGWFTRLVPTFTVTRLRLGCRLGHTHRAFTLQRCLRVWLPLLYVTAAHLHLVPVMALHTFTFTFGLLHIRILHLRYVGYVQFIGSRFLRLVLQFPVWTYMPVLRSYGLFDYSRFATRLR